MSYKDWGSWQAVSQLGWGQLQPPGGGFPTRSLVVAPCRNSPHMLCPPRSPTTLRWCCSHSWGIFLFHDPVQFRESSLSWL